MVCNIVQVKDRLFAYNLCKEQMLTWFYWLGSCSVICSLNNVCPLNKSLPWTLWKCESPYTHKFFVNTSFIFGMFNQVHTFACDNLFIFLYQFPSVWRWYVNLCVTQLLLHNSFFLLQMNILIEIPFPDSSIDFQ